VVAIPGDIKRTDSALVDDSNTSYVSQNVMQSLVGLEPGSTSKIIDVLAESHTISADKLTYTFKIRSGVKFHDGTDLTADAVVYNYNRWLNFPKPLQAYSYYAGAVFGGYGADANVAFPPATPGLSHLPQSARDACDPLLNDLPADARIGQPSARPDLPMLRRFARCMRGQPQMADWPDPDGNGTFHLPADLVGKNGPRQAQFLAARTACARFNPSGQLQLAGR